MDNLIFFITGLALGMIIWRALTRKTITFTFNHIHKNVYEKVPENEMIDMSKVMDNTKYQNEDKTYDEMGKVLQDINEEISDIMGGSDRV